MLVKFLAFTVAGLVFAVLPNSSQGQRPFVNQQVQLPTVSFFNIRTVVSVPDGGTTYLGGVSRHASGQISRGIPGFSGPFARPFRNRSYGYSASSSNMSAHVRLILARELEQDVMAEANRRDLIRQPFDPNGSQAVQQKADFISRNIGRSQR